MKTTVVAAMSGGVDSSVAAFVLKKLGYNVIGVTMNIWQAEDRCQVEDNGGCCGTLAAQDAAKVAARLDIPFYVLNFKDEFKEKVIDYFVSEYVKGRTPNPCIACNRHVKWEALLAKSIGLGAEFIATGHYANIAKLNNGRYTIQRDTENPKDQSYALYNLTQYQLEHTLMPIGGMNKEEVRKIAKELGLNTADKPDSQEICFILDNDYAAYIESLGVGGNLPGDFLDEGGNILGRHAGIARYTIGQRKGLGIAFGKPMFVKKIDPYNNTVVLAEGDKLFSRGLIADNVSCMAEESFAERKAFVKIRYSHKAAPCVFSLEGDRLICRFESPQRAVTPGQAAVFYDEEGNILCGGVIAEGIE